MPLRCLSRATSISVKPECDPSIAADTPTPPREVFNIKGDQFSSKNDEQCDINLTSTDMIALGLTTAIAYYCLVLCVAELSSALPFAGGAYGIARVTLGIFPGYLVAVCDSFKSIIYASAAAYSIGEMVSRANDGVTLIEEHRVYEFAHWAGFYVFCLCIQLYGRKFFWRVNLAFAAMSVAILFIYIFGSIRFVEFEENASYPGEEGIWRWFHGGMYEFMSVLPLGTRFFQGIQSINLACGYIKNPKTEVPKGYVWSMSFVMVTSFAVFFLATAVKPGLLIFIARLRPLSSGFKQIFGIPHHRAAIVSIPPTVVSGFGFMYRYGQQMSAMGKSGLLNPVFGNELASRNSPYVALLVGSVLGYVLCVVKWYYPDMQDQLYELSVLGAITTFLSIFASFIVFRRNFPTIQREFVSPLGLGGAIYGCLVFLLCFISVCGFQKENMAVIMYAGILAVATGNAAKANRMRRGTKAIEKKYAPVESNQDKPSATLSTKPSSSPYLQQLHDQKASHPHHLPVRRGVEPEDKEKIPENHDFDENNESIDGAEDENKERVARIAGGVTPLESHAEEDHRDYSPMSPVLLEDLEVSNRVYIELPKAPVSVAPEDFSSTAEDTTSDVLNIKGDQFHSERWVVNLSCKDMIALGLTTAIAYYCLVLCVAELSSALPFAGGAYGIARVTLGIYPGFLVAVCDSFKSIIYASAAAYSIGQMVSRANDGPLLIEENRVYEFAHWAGFYVFCLSIHLYGRQFFWRVNLAFAAISVVILFIYIFGSIRFVEFEENASYPGEEGIWRWFHGDMYEFMSVLPLGTRFFQGIQSINLACGHIKNPKTEVPKGYVWSMSFVMFTSFAVFFLATAVKPGLLIFIARLRPLSSGFKQIFGIEHHRAAIVSIPPTVVSGFGFMYRYGQQMSAMGKSGLLNPVFGNELAGRNSPYVALLVGSVLGYGLCIVQWYYPDMQDQLYALSILGATTTFLSIFASFFVFRNCFTKIQREFVSPLGVGGAVYGCLVFLLCFISVCGFQKDYLALIMFAGILVVASVYYYFVVQKRQIFSEEEKTVMFKAYVVNGNAARASRIRRGHAARDKKYFALQLQSEAPSATLSTSHLPQQEQQKQPRPVRWADGSSKKNVHESTKTKNTESNKTESNKTLDTRASLTNVLEEEAGENNDVHLFLPTGFENSEISDMLTVSYLEQGDHKC
eukprot:gene9646-11338_t